MLVKKDHVYARFYLTKIKIPITKFECLIFTGAFWPHIDKHAFDVIDN